MNDEALISLWRDNWPKALSVWSRFTRLSDPKLCNSRVEASKEGLSGSFAMIRLSDQSVVIDLESVRGLGLENFGVEVLAHEIGHHVLAPANPADQFRLLARIRRGLPTLERHAAMLANLYTDLLINDRLQRRAGLRMADIYRRMRAAAPATDGASASGVWTLYMGIYEHLWAIERGSLGGPSGQSRAGTDAWLGARLIRAYAEDWLEGAGRFATLLLPYLVEEDAGAHSLLARLHDTRDAAEGCEPVGLTEIEGSEAGGPVHPAEDPRITGEEELGPDTQGVPSAVTTEAQGRGQRREPFEYGEILKAAGVKLSEHEIAVRYYRESALPYLVSFPRRLSPESEEPLPEGVEPWELGDPLDQLDWFETVTRSPRVFPGLTTVQRQYGRTEGQARSFVPVDLDLYVDCSGSMPNPQQRLSYTALAGAIIVLSALRTGSRVQATLWSGKNQFLSTPGFVRDDAAVLRILTGYLGGGTAFPIHKLRSTFDQRSKTDRPCHILMISDDGITTMFAQDERGNSGWDVAASALAKGRNGGTMALNLPAGWEQPRAGFARVALQQLIRARDEQHWDIHPVSKLEDLLAFARVFSRRYARTPSSAEELRA